MSDFENSSFICKGNDLYTNYASAIGTAVGLSSIGGKTGVATDGSRAAKSAAYSIMGALSERVSTHNFNILSNFARWTREFL